jgi:hypothetical protein
MTVPCQMAVNKGEVKQLDLNGFHSQPCEGQFDLQTTIINKCYNKVLQSWQMFLKHPTNSLVIQINSFATIYMCMQAKYSTLPQMYVTSLFL